jgi:hypothetical protein
MKITHTLLLMLLSGFLFTACYEDEDKDLVEEITTPTEKGFYPVSGNAFINVDNKQGINANRYPVNSTVRFELQYWSESPVKEILLYRRFGTAPNITRQLISTTPHVPAFSKIKSCDTLIMSYTMPATVNTTVDLDIDIVNQNGLRILQSPSLQRPSPRTLTVRTVL